MGWLWSAGLAHAGDEHRLLLGRADADAAGAWPVLLWVREARRGAWPCQPWQPASAAALMQLERLAAAPFIQPAATSECSTRLLWAPPAPRVDHVAPLREALQHPACGAPIASFRLDAGLDLAESLPLRRLLPDLGAQAPEMLVLLLLSPQPEMQPQGLPRLRPGTVMARARPTPPVGAALTLPAQAASRFPAWHAALLGQASRDEGWGEASGVLRLDPVGIQPLKFSRYRISEDETLQALGLAGESLGWHHLRRLLLRVNPADRPEQLWPEPVVAQAPWWTRPADARRHGRRPGLARGLPAQPRGPGVRAGLRPARG